MILDDFIKRLQDLREICGGSVPVLIETEIYDHGGEYEIALAEIQNVSPKTELINDEITWKTSRHQEDNTLKIISIK